MFNTLLEKAFLMILLGAGLPLLIGAISGLLVSVGQAATQIQDQSITYLVKIAAVCGLCFLGHAWFWEQLVRFTQQTLASLVSFGHLP